jgi:cyanophycin synthetase
LSAPTSTELQSTRVCKIQALRGPNIWSQDTAIECWVAFPELPPVKPDWRDTLQASVPALEAPPALPDPVSLARLLGQLTLALQNRSDLVLEFLTVAPTSEPNVFRIVIRYDEEEIARSGFEIARQLLESALLGLPFDFASATEALHERADDICLGPSTRAMVNAATARGIPVRRLTEGSLVQLGWGRKQKKILAAATSQTSAIAEDIVQDKDLTRILLHLAGLPVPRGRPVKDADDAWAAALEIGLPVVIKPRDGNQGRAVSLNLFTREQVNAAFEAALAEGDSVIVEQFAEGDDYRLLVVGKQFVAASRRKPAHVIGDGRHTIAELVAIVNEDPRRASDHAAALSKIRIDAVALAVLAEQGMDPDSVPAKGRQILIRRNANLSTGGTAVDVTDEVHPTIKNACIEAANMVGLDICGLDLVAIDISAPLSERNGCIIELNARPGLRMHLYPSEGKPRDVGEAVISTMFEPGDQGRIPVIAVTGVNGKTTTTRFAAHLLSQTNWTVGHTSTDGVFVGGRMLDSGDCSGPKSARRLLAYPLTDAAVLEVARGGILREGLAFDCCDVAVVTNIGEGDHLGLNEVHTTEQLAMVKGCIVRNVAPTGTAVLNAADPLVVRMAETCLGAVIFFATAPDNEVIRAHCQKGGKALFVRDGSVWLAEGAGESKCIDLNEVPLTLAGTISFQVENTLAALGAVWALGLDIEIIRRGLRTFAPGFDQNAGRFNVLDIRGITVVCDYGHNIDALRALLQSLRHFQNARRIVVYSSAGDRRDEDIIVQGQMLSTEFDEAWLYEGDYVRGREAGEIMALLAKGLDQAPRTRRVESILGHLKAVDLAIESARPGDLVMIQADTADETVHHLRDTYLSGTGARVVD